jgi:hypothetical protein
MQVQSLLQYRPPTMFQQQQQQQQQHNLQHQYHLDVHSIDRFKPH